MSHKFPTISVTKLFVSIDPRPATEEERWMGLPAIVPGYRPSGNTFIDHFMPLLHAGGALPVEYYAKVVVIVLAACSGFSGDALRCRRKIGGGTIVFLDEEQSAVKFFVGRRGTLLKLGF